MKNIPEKFSPLLAASFFLITRENTEHLLSKNYLKEIFINAKLDNTLTKKILFNLDNTNLKKNKYIERLNQTKIYLLVTNNPNLKQSKKILLLLQTEDRIKAEQSLIKYKKQLMTYKLKLKRKKVLDISAKQSVRPESSSGITKIFDGPKSYYINNLGGYKSICPIFFDKDSAESFLVASSKESLSSLEALPKKTNQKVLNGLLNTQIISLGLGDFTKFYSSQNNKNFLDKVEFLFFPETNIATFDKRTTNQKNFKS